MASESGQGGKVDPRELPAGTTIAGKYRVVRTLGRGGMGHVFEAQHLALGVKVAVKVLHRESDELGAGGRFWREARAAALLESEYLARVSDYGSLDDGRPYMVLEHLEGEDLKQALSRGSMAIREVVDLGCQTCAGLAHAHAAGIVHRDLKPSNLFLVKRGRTRRLKVLDFGISKLLAGDAEGLAVVETQTEALLGTPFYMAPEQVRSAKEVDPRADLWSLGVVLYEALAGRRPFEDASLGGLFAAILEKQPPRLDALRPEVPKGLADVVHRCLAKDRAERPGDAAELASLLAPFGSEEGGVAARRARDALEVQVVSSDRGFVETALAGAKGSTPPGEPPSDTPVSARSASAGGDAALPGVAAVRGDAPTALARVEPRPSMPSDVTVGPLASGAGAGGPRGTAGARTGLIVGFAVVAGVVVAAGASALWPARSRPIEGGASAEPVSGASAGAPTAAASAPPPPEVAPSALAPPALPEAPEATAAADSSAPTAPVGAHAPKPPPRAPTSPATAAAAAPPAAPPAASSVPRRPTLR